MDINSVLPALSVVLIFGLLLLIAGSTVAKALKEYIGQSAKVKNSQVIFPLRLQAYERLCLLLERIDPNNLIVRLSDVAINVSAIQFQQVLLKEIREEYNHNLAQQMYMSQETWDRVKSAVFEVQSLINQSAGKVGAEASGQDLAKAVFEEIITTDAQPVEKALRLLKSEVRTLF